MPLSTLNGGETKGLAFLASAGIVYAVIASACSSPQTTELNASTRAETLMKWVNLGVGQAVLLLAIAAVFDRQNRVPILAGGSLAAVLMYWSYDHAKRSGLRNAHLPGTETY